MNISRNIYFNVDKEKGSQFDVDQPIFGLGLGPS